MSAEIQVRSQLNKIVEDLQKIQASARSLSGQLKDSTESVGRQVDDQVKKTQSGFDRLKGFGRRVRDQLMQDFRAMASINATMSGLQLNQQFRGTIKETMTLTDTIRKLGATFGISAMNFGSFAGKMTKGLGQIGIGSDAAAKVLEGLSTTAVRGEDAVLGYAKSASMLASIGREQGQEGKVAKGMADVLASRGMNVSDAKGRKDLESEVTAAMQATGRSASDILDSMSRMYSAMDKQMRGQVGFRGMAQMAAISTAGGPGAAKAIEEYLSKSKIERMGMESQGFGKFIGPGGGLNLEALTKFIRQGEGRIGFDPRKAMQTFGFSEEAAEGLVRLAQNSKQAGDIMSQLSNASRDTEAVYKQNRTMLESFSASLNRVKGYFEGPIAKGMNTFSGFLGKASESDVGAAGIVGGSALLSAVLLGGGLRGLGKAAGLGGMTKAAAVEGVTGREVQPVYVTNAAEIGAAGIMGAGGAGGMMSKLGTVAKVAAPIAAAAGGVAVGVKANEMWEAKAKESPESLIGRIDSKVYELVKAFAAWQTGMGGNRKDVNVKVDLNKRELKSAPAPGRGGAY